MVNNLTMPWPGVAHYRPFLAWTQTPHPCLLPCATDTACLSASNIGEVTHWVWRKVRFLRQHPSLTTHLDCIAGVGYWLCIAAGI